MRTGDAPQDEALPAAGGPAPAGGRMPAAASELLDSLRELGASGRATWTAGRDAATAFRILVSADVSLARSAFGRTLAFTGVAIAFGASAWLLLMAALIAWLSLGLGWAWSLALLATAGISLAVTALAGWMAIRYFEHTRMQATRRQLARLGIGELAGLVPDAASGQSAEEGAEQVAEVAEEQPVKKGLGIDVTPP
jgi:hypothetical protein